MSDDRPTMPPAPRTEEQEADFRRRVWIAAAIFDAIQAERDHADVRVKESVQLERERCLAWAATAKTYHLIHEGIESGEWPK